MSNIIFGQPTMEDQLRRLERSLESLVVREETTWDKKVFNQIQMDEVNINQRNSTIVWLRKLSTSMLFGIDTFVLAVELLDRCLSKLKVRPKVLQCLTVACLYIAAKCKEEDEKISITPEFVIDCDAHCSANELLRMERLILDKFDWFVGFVTPIDFLQIYYSILIVKINQENEHFSEIYIREQYNHFEIRLSLCLQNHRLSSYRPRVLSLALISLEFERQQMDIRFDWLISITYLQQLAKIESDELLTCRDLIIRSLLTYKVIRLDLSDLKLLSQIYNPSQSIVHSSNRPSYADVVCGRSWLHNIH